MEREARIRGEMEQRRRRGRRRRRRRGLGEIHGEAWMVDRPCKWKRHGTGGRKMRDNDAEGA